MARGPYPCPPLSPNCTFQSSLEWNKTGSIGARSLWGREPIHLVSVDLVVSLSRNSTPHTTLNHLGGRNREVCELCLALPPVSGVGVHSAPIKIIIIILSFGLNIAASKPSFGCIFLLHVRIIQINTETLLSLMPPAPRQKYASLTSRKPCMHIGTLMEFEGMGSACWAHAALTCQTPSYTTGLNY